MAPRDDGKNGVNGDGEVKAERGMATLSTLRWASRKSHEIQYNSC